MYLNGKWVGFGYGVGNVGEPGYVPPDVDPKVLAMKQHVHRKFLWVRNWSPSLVMDEVYDQNFAQIVMEMQRRYGLPVTGIMNAATQQKCGFWKPSPPVRPTLYTVCGTGVPWWVGPDADVGRWLDAEGRYRWQPVGYPARPFPMWSSIMLGVEELARLVSSTPGKFSLMGYSQGAVVVSYFYKYYLLQGPLQSRLPDLLKVVTLGNPMREANVCRWDGVGKPCRPNTAGILEDRLVGTPPFWAEFGHEGDLYTDVELDDEGEHKRAIGKIVMADGVGGIFGGSDSIIAQLIELGVNPFGEGMKAAMALLDAGMFAVRGTGPHVNYNPHVAADFLRS